MSNQQIVNVNVNAPPGPYVPVFVKRQPGCLIQILWFVFVGWWLGALAIAFAYLMFDLIITIPIGIAIVNRVPELMALRSPPTMVTYLGQISVPQRPFWLRALWFLLVGWWLAGLVMALGYALCLTLIGMPLGFWLFDVTPELLTLRRNSL